MELAISERLLAAFERRKVSHAVGLNERPRLHALDERPRRLKPAGRWGPGPTLLGDAPTDLRTGSGHDPPPPTCRLKRCCMLRLRKAVADGSLFRAGCAA